MDEIMVDIGAQRNPAQADKIIVATTLVNTLLYVHVTVYDPSGIPVAFALKPRVALEVARVMQERAEELLRAQEDIP